MIISKLGAKTVSRLFPAACSLTFLLSVMFLSAGAAQQNGGAKASKPGRVYTNDDIARAHSRYDNDVPEIPGLIKCGEDLDCFLRALEDGAPAAVTRGETAEQGTAVVSSNSTWWTTRFSAGRCTVSFRVDSLEAKVNEKVVPAVPRAARGAAQARLEQMKRDFAEVRGKSSVCSVNVKDLKALMTSAAWSPMALGPVTNFGKDCSGPGFGP